jgi:hypothetical protein
MGINTFTKFIRNTIVTTSSKSSLSNNTVRINTTIARLKMSSPTIKVGMKVSSSTSSSQTDQAEDIASKTPMSAETSTEEEASSPSSGGGVRFRSRASIEEVRRISRISNYDLDEVINYWGDREEHKLRKEELKLAAAEMQYSRRLSDNVEYTTLGIADKVGDGRAVKIANRMMARNAVLDEQELQTVEGVVNDELLADVYWSVTESAKQRAEEKAANLRNQVESFSS